MYKVSVIIPVYNGEQYINKCYKSLVEQSYKEFEIIFIDDGSSDCTLSLLNSIKENDVRVNVLSQENQGQAVARNKGIREATGEFLCFVDIDDYVHEDMLFHLVQKQIMDNADIVWCNAFIERNSDTIGCLDDNKYDTGNEIKDYMLNNSGPWRKLIRKNIICMHNLYFPSIRFYEDLAIVAQWGLWAKKISYIAQPLYYYILHDGSTMHQLQYNSKLECIFDSLIFLEKGFKNTNKDAMYGSEIEYMYIDHLLHAASLRFFKFDEGKPQLEKIIDVMKTKFPNWNKNQYYVKKNLKYKIVCFLFYHHCWGMLRKLLKS